MEGASEFQSAALVATGNHGWFEARTRRLRDSIAKITVVILGSGDGERATGNLIPDFGNIIQIPGNKAGF